MCLRERKRVRTREWEIFGIKHSNTDGSPLHSEATCIALFFQSHSSPNASPPPSTYNFVANSLVRIYLSFLPLTVTRLLFQTHITLARTHTHTFNIQSILSFLRLKERERERREHFLREAKRKKLKFSERRAIKIWRVLNLARRCSEQQQKRRSFSMQSTKEDKAKKNFLFRNVETSFGPFIG